MSFSAEIVADSLDGRGNRLTSFLLTMPRIVLAEFNTHRMLSRNSASSRAIPFAKMAVSVEKNPFIPIQWMKEHKGMQGTEYWTDSQKKQELEREWLDARDRAVLHAYNLANQGLTKQICNRLLEPFMWHTVLATATDWENFFALRANSAAEIHIQHLAYKMLETYNANVANAVTLRPGEWHVPFAESIDYDQLQLEVLDPLNKRGDSPSDDPNFKDAYERAVVKIATARCAQTSYIVIGEEDKPMNYAKLVALHDRLSDSGHWSPFEHCAKRTQQEYYEDSPYSGNFRGFTQYRKLFQNENRSDSRVIR